MLKLLFMKATALLTLAVLLSSQMLASAQTVNQSQVVSIGGGTSSGGIYSNFAVVGEPCVAYHISGNAYSSDNGFIYRLSDATILNLTLYLEGLYNGVGLNKAQGTSGNQFPDQVADKINVELHNTLNYPTIAYSDANVSLSGTGQVSVIIPESHSGSYYVTVKHRNSLETVSAQPLSFSGGTRAYDFSLSAAQAYGSNLKLLPTGAYGIFSGDVNADGKIDLTDADLITTAATGFTTGYFTTDLNGDGIVDALDLIVVDNNAANFRMKITP